MRESVAQSLCALGGSVSATRVAPLATSPGFLDVRHILGAAKSDRVYNCVALAHDRQKMRPYDLSQKYYVDLQTEKTEVHRWTYESYGATRVLVFDLGELKSIE